MPHAPALSVIIPTFNRRERLARVLEGLARQTVAAERFEVLVVDDGSTDDTAQWLEAQKYPFALRLMRQKNGGPAAARNAGVQAAAAPIVLFLDDDVVPATQLIAEHLRGHEEDPGCAVIGPLSSLPSYAQPWVAWEQEKVEAQYQAMKEGRYAPTYRQFWTGNASVSRARILEVGGFDGKLRRAEDIELAARMAEKGLRFRFRPEASGLHHAERSLQAWARMHEQYGQVEVSIHGRWGEKGALDTLAQNFRRLHPVTRVLVQACARSGLASGAAAWALETSVAATAAAGAHRAARAACSLLANVRYWEGVKQALGGERLRELFARD